MEDGKSRMRENENAQRSVSESGIRKEKLYRKRKNKMRYGL